MQRAVQAVLVASQPLPAAAMEVVATLAAGATQGEATQVVHTLVATHPTGQYKPSGRVPSVSGLLDICVTYRLASFSTCAAHCAAHCRQTAALLQAAAVGTSYHNNC